MRWSIHRYRVVESTNDVARALVEAGEKPLPFVVITDHQTRGRGRSTNPWWSDEGSLTFTLAIDPAAYGMSPLHEPRLALATAVAIIEAIAHELPTSNRPGIRWPNDVEVDGRKLGGILPERVETTTGSRLLIGIGMNIHTNLFGAPEEIRGMAVSLADLCGTCRTRSEILGSILQQLELILPKLSANDQGLATRWAELDTLRGETVRVDLGTSVLTGIGRGIDAEGALVLITDEGESRLFGGRVLRAGNSSSRS